MKESIVVKLQSWHITISTNFQFSPQARIFPLNLWTLHVDGKSILDFATYLIEEYYCCKCPPSPRKLREDNVFTGVCLAVCSDNGPRVIIDHDALDLTVLSVLRDEEPGHSPPSHIWDLRFSPVQTPYYWRLVANTTELFALPGFRDHPWTTSGGGH